MTKFSRSASVCLVVSLVISLYAIILHRFSPATEQSESPFTSDVKYNPQTMPPTTTVSLNSPATKTIMRHSFAHITTQPVTSQWPKRIGFEPREESTVVWSHAFQHIANLGRDYFEVSQPKRSWNGNIHEYQNIQRGDIVYVWIKEIPLFFRDVFDHIPEENAFILMTGDDDSSAPVGIFEQVKSHARDSVLNSSKLVKWFAQNCDLCEENEKMEYLPIGLDLHTSTQGIKDYRVRLEQVYKQEIEIRTVCRYPRLHCFSNVNVFSTKRSADVKQFVLSPVCVQILMSLPELKDRPCKAYANFHHAGTGKRWGPKLTRQYVKNTLMGRKGIDFARKRTNRHDTWRIHGNYFFIISPFGNGFDCHRTWEALVLGSVPIVHASTIDHVYDDLPVVIVDDWEDVSLENMQRWRKEILDAVEKNMYNWEKLTMKYWSRAIYAVQHEVLNQEK